MAKNLSYEVRLTVQDNFNGGEISAILESAVVKALASSVEDIKIYEPREAGAKDNENDPMKPRAKTPKEIEDTQDWEDANTEDASKFSEARQVVPQEAKQVSKYMKNKQLQEEIIAFSQTLTDEQLPVLLRYSTKQAQENWKIEKATEVILMRRANEEEIL